MSRKSARRARRQAINELLAHQEPPSRLDQLDQRGKVLEKEDTGPLTADTKPVPPAQRLQVPEQAGPSRSETTADLAAHRR